MRVVIAPPSGITASLAHCSLRPCVTLSSGLQLGPGRTAWKKNVHESHVPSGLHCSGGIAGGVGGVTGTNTQGVQSVLHCWMPSLSRTWPTTLFAQLSTATLASVWTLVTGIQHG